MPLSTWTLLMVPRFSPASAPMNVGLPAVMLTSARLMLRTVAPLPITGNNVVDRSLIV